ncbi:S9 family peptidase [Kordiimonas gwangyangensis]|uniref:S9 family peptidase n=1 Tax=Kordiimonas gwangyangensis TaxID=288022 RepID=UPI0006846F73|nr:S9 family peptidase [Kordiimonas gwangyangensis]
MAAAVGASAAVADDDPYLWLEEVEGEKALEWVHERNKHSLGILEADERFTPLMERALKDYNAKDKIAYGTLMGGAVHNFWQDEKNVRGIWRRTSLKSYKGDEPNWITILDFDKLAEEEGENWVYKSRDCLAPDFGRCLINLSRGGGDAVVVREFDAVTKRFVDGGFETPESKQGSAWIDADTILIGTNFGEGTMTDSGYANQIKVWKRNNPLEIATLVHEGNTKDVGSFPFASHRPDGTYVGVVQAPDFFTEVIHVLDGESDDWTQKEMRPLQLPKDISFKGFFGDTVIVQMRKDWALGSKTVKAGTLVSIKVADALEGRAAASVTEIFVPTERSSIDGVSIGKDRLFLSILDEVTGQLVSAKPGPQLGSQQPWPARERRA